LLPTIFKKIKLYTHENVGWGEIHLPEETMHTTAYWLALPEPVAASVDRTDLEGGLVGLATVLVTAPLFLMCDPRDLGLHREVARRSPAGRPSTSTTASPRRRFRRRLFHQHADLLEAAADLVRRCPAAGCPRASAQPTRSVRGPSTALRLLSGLVPPAS
jgi:DEAD/DEAH box helicase domain-containing protein